MYFFISEIGWMFRPHHHPTDFLLWKRRPRPRSSMLPAGRSAAPERLPPGFPIPAQPPCDLALTEPTKVLPEDPPHDCSLLRIHAQLPLLILIETEQPRRIHMHYLFHRLLLTNHNSTSSPLLQFSPEETTSRRLAPVFRGFISHHAANASVFTSSRAVQQCSCSSRFRFSSSSLNNFWQLSFQNPLYA